MGRSLAVLLYRSFHRQIQKVKAMEGAGLYVQNALNPQSEFGRFVYFDTEEYDKNICHNLISSWPNEKMEKEVSKIILANEGRWISAADLGWLVKHSFKNVAPANGKELNKFLDFGIDSLKELQKLMILRKFTTIKHNECANTNVTITATTSASPMNVQGTNTNTFFYRITFENLGKGSVQLLGRNLKFTGKDIPPLIIPKWAPGVVGEKPILNGGEGFSYMSCCSLEGAESGEMEGSFRFCDSEGTPFEVFMEKTPLQ